jgi:preprotein translocase subunit SecY
VLQTLRNAWKVPELRYKILVTLFILLLYRFGAVIPVPFVSAEQLGLLMQQGEGSIFQYLNILSGNAFSRATLFALGIQPYINSSIIMQLLTIAIPALEKMQKSGDEGKKKITQITRFVTVGLGLVMAYGYYMYMRSYQALTDDSLFAAFVIIASYSAGSALIMWLGEKINESGIGNGISLILFANIVSGGVQLATMLLSYVLSGIPGTFLAIGVTVIAIAIVTLVVFITNSERRLPVQYAKKMVGRKMYGGQSTNLPIKLNMSGVMPIIFANSIVAIPSTVALLFPTPAEGSFWANVQGFLSYTSWFYALLFFVLIIAFGYFYIAISFNPVEVANNLQKNGGFIPGIRPGKPTSVYITKVLGRITLIGSLFLGFIAVFPLIVNIASNGYMGSVAFGGSSLLIVVGVVLETNREIEAQMTMRNYKGFLE